MMGKTGLIGLGEMGRRIAVNILKRGFPLTVYDIVPEKRQELVRSGADATDSIAGLGAACDTVLVMVGTFAQCKEVFAQLLPVMKKGTVVCLGTIAPSDSGQLAAMAIKEGVTYADCPVSGGTKGADGGTLTLMFSGPHEIYEELHPLLSAFGEYIVYVSEGGGSAQALKAVNQLLVGVHMCAMAEAFNLARQCGLDQQLVLNVLRRSAGDSYILASRGQYLIDRDFHTRSTLAIQEKDTAIICELAEHAGAPVFLADQVLALFREAKKICDPADDPIEVVKVYEAGKSMVTAL